MEIPLDELKEVIDRFEKDIEAGISSRNWLPYLAKIHAWLEAAQHGHEAELPSPQADSMLEGFGVESIEDLWK